MEMPSGCEFKTSVQLLTNWSCLFKSYSRSSRDNHEEIKSLNSSELRIHQTLLGCTVSSILGLVMLSEIELSHF